MSGAIVYIKENFKFIYSLLLIIIIPAVIIASGLLDIKNTQKQMDNELENKATMAEEVFVSSISDNVLNNDFIQGRINQTIAASPDIKEITVLKPQSNGFMTAATSNTQSFSLTFTSQDYTKAWVSQENVATLTQDTSTNPPSRAWVIISPVKDGSLQEQALAVMKVSLQNSDVQTKKNVAFALITLVVTIFFVLLLLINHFRFYKYAVSFKSLSDIDKMKDDFISIASHEMKTPMAAIKGYLSMIAEGVAGKIDQRAKDHLDKVNANVRRLDILVNELLDVSRLEQQRVQFDMQPVDVTDVTRHIFSELEARADEKKIYLKTQELPTPHPLIFADSERLAQALDNIIGNAIKYTEKGGVEITYQIANGKLYTQIKDTGIGISETDQKRLFEKFYRIQNRKTIDISGTGLGLWISREMIKRMNGNIAVSSKEGLGSVFTVSFSIIREK
ncbi:MAG: HAMP domain-containing sensor histidine kinase [Patescibacteria group bacterium]